MRNLLAFIFNRYYVLLFLFLEIISVLLFVNDSYYQRTTFINATNEITGNINQGVNDVSDYFSLKRENEILAIENARFHDLAIDAFNRTDRAVFVKNDTVYKQQYDYIAAKIISNSVMRRDNYLMLNKGSLDGIEKDMAVISPLGVVGIVKNVSSNFCTVISMLHKDMKLSAKIKKNDYVGTVVWNGGNYRLGNLKDIPFHVLLAHGDTVLTSGYSLLFPEGIMVGNIENFHIVEGDNFYNIKIRFSNDFNRISYVYVVRNLMKKEQDALKEEQIDE